MSYFSSLWNGDAPLWVAYWINGALINNLLGLAVESVVTDEYIDNLSAGDAFGFISVALLVVGYLVFSLVAIWRCAQNAAHPIFAGLARISVVVSVILCVIAFWQGLAG